jgi:hypothetical protein
MKPSTLSVFAALPEVLLGLALEVRLAIGALRLVPVE